MALEALLLAAITAQGWTSAPRRTSAPTDMSYFYGDENELRTVTASARRIPGETYSTIVRDMIVPCIDLVLEDVETRDLLLVKRSDEPMKDAWWLVGGRMRKGTDYIGTPLTTRGLFLLFWTVQ